MSDVAIRVEGLSKRYSIKRRERYKTLRESLMEAITSPFRRLSNFCSSIIENSYIWALKDVSFEVKRGEVVGIIGPNGAGKTTLLKILSRITEPTEGHAEIHGRVGSLLEVGTGFHPELTGRENIYLNGAILGMRKAEIGRKFDEIADFAEIEKFIDTPVKRYSSGMYVRLAFAVAAHLEPEILLVDEVLAVGDAAFQKKCLGKMDDVAKAGRTVLFISHNMAAINRLCHHGIWLNAGRLQMAGAAEKVIAAYLSTATEAEGERRWENLEEAPGNEKIRLRAVRLLNSNSEVSSTLDRRSSFCVEIEYDILYSFSELRVGFALLTADGVIAFCSHDSEDASWQGKPRDPGSYVSTCTIPGLLLNSGLYTLLITADIPYVELFFWVENVLTFLIEEMSGIYIPYHDRPPGVMRPSLQWHVSKRKIIK